MAVEIRPTDQSTEKPESSSQKGGMFKKILIFGVPAFLVQLVLIYFLTAKFVVPITQHYQIGDHSGKDKGSVNHNESGGQGKDEDGGTGEQRIYVVKDLIINPAGTNGQRYLLSTIAFNVSTDEALKSLEKKEMAVRDLLNSILTGKTMDQLIDVGQRESLRQEIASKATTLVDHGKLNSVYFSKYIIQ